MRAPQSGRAQGILEGFFIAEAFRAYGTLFFRQEKCFQDLLDRD
jgi:hypothetical protein